MYNDFKKRISSDEGNILRLTVNVDLLQVALLLQNVLNADVGATNILTLAFVILRLANHRQFDSAQIKS